VASALLALGVWAALHPTQPVTVVPEAPVAARDVSSSEVAAISNRIEDRAPDLWAAMSTGEQEAFVVQVSARLCSGPPALLRSELDIISRSMWAQMTQRQRTELFDGSQTTLASVLNLLVEWRCPSTL
jgi:hypothetical protein